jgi:hypothetical protein
MPTPEPTPDAGPETPSFTEAAHPNVPQLISLNGPIMRTPHIVLITFEGDTERLDLESFVSRLGTSTWWTEAVGEYGVASPTATFVRAPTLSSTSLDDTKVNQFFTDNLKSGGLLGAFDPNAIYVLALASGVSITTTIAGLTGHSCIEFGGFHSETVVGGQAVVFAAIPRCGAYPPPPLHTLTGIDLLTYAMAHELVEAVVDPHPMSQPGYVVQRDTGSAIGLATGPENADMCVMIDSPEVKPADLGYDVPRAWSNAAASAGHDPCAPAPVRPYFNVVAVMPDLITVPDPYDLSHTKTTQTQGLHLAPGDSRTISLTLYSDAPTDAWSLDAVNTELLPFLSFTFSKTVGQNGDVVQLTITRSSLPGQDSAAGFAVRSTLNGVENDWFGIVAQ